MASLSRQLKEGTQRNRLLAMEPFSQQLAARSKEASAREARVALWLRTHAPPALGAADVAVWNSAALHGNVEVLQWLHDNGKGGCGASSWQCAALGGHLPVIQWLHQNRKEGCSAAAMQSAVQKGHTAIVQYLQTHGLGG